MSPPANTPDSDSSRRAPRRKPGRVPTSCAECRRLKLKCDRQVPCITCITKGCADICPDGIRSAMRIRKQVDTTDSDATLKAHVAELNERICLLEAALAELQALVSEKPHPLLVPQSETTHDTAEEEVVDITKLGILAVDPPPALSEEDSFVDAFGLLTLGPSGETTFLGRGSRSEYLIADRPSSAAPSTEQTHTFPRLSSSPRVREAARRVHEDHFVDRELGEEVYALLPPLGEAYRLCEAYLHQSKYMMMPITRQELFDTYLHPVYNASSYSTLGDPNLLSAVLAVFALAMLDDPCLPAATDFAQEYYLLAWVAFYCTFPARVATVPLVETLLNLAWYEELEGRDLHGPWRSWMTTGMAVRFGHSIGLHLSASKWNLSDEAVRARRRICRSMFFLDTFVSAWCGRPPAMSVEWTDLGFDRDRARGSSLATDNGTTGGDPEAEHHVWLTNFGLLTRTVVNATCSLRLPTYALVLRLDRRIREFHVPHDMRAVCYNTPEERDAAEPEAVIRRHGTLSLKEHLLLTLHRSYFGQALAESPNDLSHHRFAPSVVASYRSAWRLIKAMHWPLTLAAKEIYRISITWSQLMSAAIVMSLLAIKAPSSPLTTSALAELDDAVCMFADSAPSCPAAAHHLETMQRLQRKAHDAVRGLYENSAQDQREIDRLNGQTQLLLHDGATLTDGTPPPSIPPPPSTNASVSAPAGLAAPNYDSDMMPWERQGYSDTPFIATDSRQVTIANLLHPTVASDMRVFNTDLFTPISTTEPWSDADPEHDAMVPPRNINSNPLWDDAFAVTASDVTTHPGQPYDPTVSANDMYYNSRDPLSFVFGGAADDLFGFGVGVAGFDQMQSNEQATPQSVMNLQTTAAHADSTNGAPDQQQQVLMQLGEGSLERVEIEKAWHGFMEQLGLPGA